MVTDAKFNVLSQSQAPRLATVTVECEENQLVVNARGMPALHIPTHPAVDQSKIVICK